MPWEMAAGRRRRAPAEGAPAPRSGAPAPRRGLSSQVRGALRSPPPLGASASFGSLPAFNSKKAEVWRAK